MTDRRAGLVTTFYSYKGGTGRTMALANIAWILAANGYRVLVVDWDLESPGLHRFFHPFITPTALDTTGGVIDMMRHFNIALTDSSDRPGDWHVEYARVSQYAFSLNWDHFPEGGGIDFMSAGRHDDTYAPSLAALDWDRFYQDNGGAFLKALRANMKANYDYTLIDSRTGVSDVADICTTHLPDVLVDCFTLSEQGIAGAHEMATSIRNPRHPIRILPVPMRVDPAEQDRANAGRTTAMLRFAGLPVGMQDYERTAYWREVEVPYQAYYAYEEMLATFGDLPGHQASLSSAYERLTRHITNGVVHRLPPQEESLRAGVAARFIRKVSVPEERVLLRYAPEDQAWAEWVEEVLDQAGVIVYQASTPNLPDSVTVRELVIISQGRSQRNAAKYPAEPTGLRPPLGIYVANVRFLPAFPSRTAAILHDQPEPVAIDRLLHLVGRADQPYPALTMRYPGLEPAVFNVPARNPNFTGREEDLRTLRRSLVENRQAALVQQSPVALHGWGGIGKTQVAIEYAHRFRNTYDVLWWIVCDPASFIDTGISDLAKELGIVPSPNIPETTRAVLATLARGEPHRRWLIIFDNAGDYEQLKSFIPHGDGSVLITSRNTGWAGAVTSIPVDVFDRAESISHLQQRVEGLSVVDAGKVADVLGDLPIAVAAAGAWLRETGTPIARYLQQIEREGPSALSVEATWDLLLQRLQDQSRGAYRLLQLCSVMSPETALELIYSDEMAAVLKPFDPSVTDRLVRGSLVQQINRLALLKLDVSSGRINLHRLLQHVIRERMTVDERAQARHQVHLVLSGSRPDQDVDNPDSWPRFRMLWPHLEVSGAAACPDEAVRALMIDRVRYLWLRGGLEQGETLALEIIAGWVVLLDQTVDEDERLVLRRQILHLRFNLANILRDLARFEHARQLDEEVLAAQEALLGPVHPHTLMTANGLAADLRALGLYAESLERDEATHTAWAEVFGEDHPRTLTALNNLASSYRLMGDYRRARELDAAVYDRQRAITGNERHPITLRSAANLGRDMREAGEYQASVSLLRAVAADYARAFGADSRFALNASTNLAISLRSAGLATDAAPLLEMAYEQFTDSVGPTSPDTLACRLSWSLNLLSTRDVTRAQRELAAVRDAYTQGLGERHPHTLVCLTNLAAVARADGDDVLARSLALAAHTDIKAVLGPDHPYTLAAGMNHAITVAEAGEAAPAIEAMEDLVTRLQQVLGPDHPDTIRGEANLALARRPRNGAVAGQEQLLARLATRIGLEHPAVEAFREHRFLHRVLDPHPF